MTFKLLLRVLLSCLAALVAAGSSNAKADVFVTSGGIYDGSQISVNGQNEYATALGITEQGSGNTLFWVFCVDLNHNIFVNIGSQLTYNPAIDFKPATVTNNSNGVLSGTGAPISTQVSQEIQFLASTGIGAINASGLAQAPTSWSSSLKNEFQEIQAAIWTVEYNFTISSTSGVGKVNAGSENAAISSYITAAQNFVSQNPLAPEAGAIYATSGTTQAQATGQGVPSLTTAVPEASTWAMMILGLCGMGLLAYRRNSKSTEFRFV